MSVKSVFMNKISFCPDCYKRGGPKDDDVFLYFNYGHQDLLVEKIFVIRDRFKIYHPGFSPHILMVEDYGHKSLIYNSYCGICDCGLYFDDFGFTYDLYRNIRKGYMRIKEWNRLFGSKEAF